MENENAKESEPIAPSRMQMDTNCIKLHKPKWEQNIRWECPTCGSVYKSEVVAPIHPGPWRKMWHTIVQTASVCKQIEVPDDMKVHPLLEGSLWTMQSLTNENRKKFFEVCGRLWSLKTGKREM